MCIDLTTPSAYHVNGVLKCPPGTHHPALLRLMILTKHLECCACASFSTSTHCAFEVFSSCFVCSLDNGVFNCFVSWEDKKFLSKSEGLGKSNLFTSSGAFEMLL